MATRRAWRPPSNSVDRNVSRISSARPTPTTRAPMRQHVGVVVGPGHAGRVEVVAQRGPHAADLVGRQLLALAAAAEDDADLGPPVAHGPADGGAERRVVDRFGRVGAEVVDVVTLVGEHARRSAPSARSRRGRSRWRSASSAARSRSDSRQSLGAALGRVGRRSVGCRGDGARSPHPRDRRRRPVPAPGRRPRGRAGAGGADGARRSSPPPPTPGWPGRPPSTRSGSSARCRGSTATRRGCWPAGSGLSPSELAYTTAGGNTPQTLVNLTSLRDARRPPRRGGAGRRRGVAHPHAGPQGGRHLDVGEGAGRRAAGDDRQGPRDDPPGRGRRGDRTARAGVPDVRDRAAGRRRPRSRRAPRRGSASCGRASARSPPATRTHGSRTPRRPRRSARRRRATG